MPSLSLLLIQKPDSPYGPVIADVLDPDSPWAARPPLAMRASGAPLPRSLESGRWLVLWDLHGFSPEEAEQMAQGLAREEVGVMLVADQMDQSASRLLGLCKALSMVLAPAGPEEVWAGLEVCFQAMSRVQKLLDQRAQLEQDLADRLVVEDAKRLVMLQQGLSEPEAMRWMQKLSRDTNQKLVVVARGLLAGHKKP